MEKTFNQEQSVELIKVMIQQAKGNVAKESGNYLLLWGHIYFLLAALHFITLQCVAGGYLTAAEGGLYTNISYKVGIFIGVLGHIILYKKESRSKTVVCYTDYMISANWAGVGVGILIILFTLNNMMNISVHTICLYIWFIYVGSDIKVQEAICLNCYMCVLYSIIQIYIY